MFSSITQTPLAYKLKRGNSIMIKEIRFNVFFSLSGARNIKLQGSTNFLIKVSTWMQYNFNVLSFHSITSYPYVLVRRIFQFLNKDGSSSFNLENYFFKMCKETKHNKDNA